MDAIPLARPSITDSERSAAQRVLSTSQLTSGPEGLRFEKLLAQHSGREHALATSSGTSALELAIRALSLAPGDKVLVTAFGFPAAANLIADRGALPIAIDVNAATWLADFGLAEKACDDKTKALVTIDQLGAVTRATDILAFEASTGVPVISDAACGFGGADQDGKPAGSAGRFATFSFHPRKVITTGEGGAIVCDDPELAERLFSLRNHGQIGGGRFGEAGTNARLSELPCAIGSAQLARLQAMLIERRMLVEGYKQRLASLAERQLLEWQVLPEAAVHANQTFAVLLAGDRPRSEVVTKMAAKKIECGAATYSFAEIEIHRDCGLAPNARRLHQGALALPLYLGMRSAELDRVCDTLREVLL